MPETSSPWIFQYLPYACISKAEAPTRGHQALQYKIHGSKKAATWQGTSWVSSLSPPQLLPFSSRAWLVGVAAAAA